MRKSADAISPGRELLLCCARARIDSGTRNHIRTLVSTGLNWPDVMSLAIQHRVLPTLYEGIAAAASDLIPRSQQQSLREAAHSSTVNGMTLVSELLRLNQLFAAAKIPVIPYKGPVLAWLAYGSFVRREYIDLDFAVPQRFIPAATEILLAAGYSAMFDLREVHAGQNEFAPGQYSFISGQQRLQVELHTERTLRYFPTPPDFEDLRHRLLGIDIAGQRLYTFSIEDTLVFLSIHGAKHFWERLAWILDVAQLITVREVDWTLLIAVAARMKATRVLLLGLYLAHDFCGASLPPQVLQMAMADKQVPWLAAVVREEYAGNSEPGAGVWARAVFRVRSSDGTGRGLRHLLRLTMSPTESDRETIRLPGILAPLYILIRPWRLLREYGLGLKPRTKPDPVVGQPADIVDPALHSREDKR